MAMEDQTAKCILIIHSDRPKIPSKSNKLQLGISLSNQSRMHSQIFSLSMALELERDGIMIQLLKEVRLIQET